MARQFQMRRWIKMSSQAAATRSLRSVLASSSSTVSGASSTGYWRVKLCRALKCTHSSPDVSVSACAPQALVPMAVEGEIAVDDTSELRADGEAERCLVITHPAVELGADEIEVARRGTAFAFADALGVLAAQPRLDGVRILVLADLGECPHAVLPHPARACAELGVGNVGEEVAFEHVRGCEREPAVVHGLEDGVASPSE